MIEPTERLLRIAEGKNIHYTFFVDVGYLIQAGKHEVHQEDVKRVEDQIKGLIDKGHDVQLHIHPHWEKSIWKDGRWYFATRDYYKLSDFSKEESADIVRKYKVYIDNLIGRKTTTFRAGGWCIQPFDHLKEVFEEVGIKMDTTIIPGDYMQTDSYAIDFRDAPLKSRYKFNIDPLIEEEGAFTEYPIGSLRYSPLFFWRLYGLGRMFPSRHKMMGDGTFLSQGGRKKRVLFSYTEGHISTDGYFSSKLNAGLNRYQNLEFNDLVIIGHPKGCTEFSLKKLKEFVERNHKKHNFISFHDLA